MIDLVGAIDVHVHAGPELFPRIGDSVAIARRAQESGMRGMVFKCHHEGTVTRAQRVVAEVEGFDAWGGVVLNGFVGGINPLAVAAQLDLGGRIVWMPTLHARHHVRQLGAGTYGIPPMTVSAAATMTEGITILDGAGQLTRECLAVIQVVKDHDAVLATGHLGPEEADALVDACTSADVICLLTHALLLGQTLDDVSRLADKGALVEISAAPFMPMAHHLFHGGPTLKDARSLIERVGPERALISSDCGQLHNPWPSDALLSFLRCLEGIGIEEAALRRMVSANPLALMTGSWRQSSARDGRAGGPQ